MTDSTADSRTRLSLLARARDRQPEAWRELVELYGPLIAYWCQGCRLPSPATADCIQEVFSAVSRSLDRFEPQCKAGAFRSWLWTITANKIRDCIRSERRQASAIGGSSAHQSLMQIPDESSVPVDEPSSAEALRELTDRAMQRVRTEFEVKTWQIFERVVIDQIDTALVAAEFGIQPSTVRQVRSRVLRRLREQLGDL